MSTAADDLRGERAAHAIYGSIVVLAVIVAEDGSSVTVGEAIASVTGAAVVTAMAELYADYIGATIRARRHPTESEWKLDWIAGLGPLRSVAIGLGFAVLGAGLVVLKALA